MIAPAYRYRATPVAVHDGDTFTVLLDLGFSVSTQQRIRLRGVNAPELSIPEGVASGNWLRATLLGPLGTDAKTLIVETAKRKSGSDIQSFVRFVADAWLEDTGDSVADLLLAAGHAQPYPR